MCNCDICKRARRYLKIIKDLSKEDKEFMEEILNNLYSAEDLLDYYKNKDKIDEIRKGEYGKK